MKNAMLLSVLLLLVFSFNLQAQTYTTDVPYHMPFDSSYVVGQGVIDSFDIGAKQGYVSGQFILCHNATLIFKGNQSSSSPSFYLYPGSSLILEDSYFYPTVYMMGMSSLDAKGGNQNIICHREGGTVLTDTANMNWIKDSIHTSINFTFSTWPNGLSPCPAPQSVKDMDILKANIFIDKGQLNYTLADEGPAQLRMFDLQGRRLVDLNITQYGQLDVSTLASGIYILHIEQKGRLRKQKVFLN